MTVRYLSKEADTFFVALLLSIFTGVHAHGYLKSPRSRNYVAYKAPWWPTDANTPKPEDCVQCLSTGGAAARCGKVGYNNYDRPKSGVGTDLPNLVQATYQEGSLVDLEVILTAHHQGHFTYKACPISPGEVPTQECFDEHPLTFVQDNLYGAVADPNYPERAYLPPVNMNGIVMDSTDVPGSKYSHKYRLPDGLTGPNVLIQWHYITANRGCVHEGYEDYDWPPGFKTQYTSSRCPPLSASGSGTEQFWNCAEVQIIASDTTTTTTSTTTSSTTTTSGTTTTTINTGATTVPPNKKPVGDSCVTSTQCASSSCFDSTCECRTNSDCMIGEICDKRDGSVAFPCVAKTDAPSQSKEPTSFPSTKPSLSPSVAPSFRPTGLPTITQVPTLSQVPSQTPTLAPSSSPTISLRPSKNPSSSPSSIPSAEPSSRPSKMPSYYPTTTPSVAPSLSNNPTESPSGQYEATVAAYYASWQWYDRSKLAKPMNIDFRKVDRVNFAFFQINTAGDMWGTDSWADPQLLFGPLDWNPPPGKTKHCSWDGPSTKNCANHFYEEGIIHLAHAAGTEVYPSIGGWTLSDEFPAMAANPSARENFANNCVKLIQEYDFDGIDIDWEYPGYADHKGTEDDKENFNLLLDDVRFKLDELTLETGKRYGLTAALPCGPNHMSNIDIPHINSRLDELNVMSYDFHGSWSTVTGVNAPMTYQGWGPIDFSVDDCVRNWIEGGGSREKINLGLSFYGRSFAGATGLNQPFNGADMANWSADEGTPQYYNILARLPSMISVRDEATKSQYAYFPAGGLVSFDDERSVCDKTEYAIDNKLHGFLIWELSGDLLQDLSTPLLDSINAKLENPNKRCSDLGSGSTTTSTTTTSATNSGTGATVTTTTSSTSTNGNGKCNRPDSCAATTMSCGPNLPCPNGLCCSQWGYCGRGYDYCGGQCCQNGPCDNGCR